MKKYVVYKITNRINGLMYVGQTCRSLTERFNDHCVYPKTRTPSKIQEAIKKFGRENFDIEVLEESTNDKIDDLEVYYINKLNTIYPNGYNVWHGGRPISPASHKCNHEELIKYYLECQSVPLTCQKFGLSDQRVGYLLDQAKIPRRRLKKYVEYTEEDKQNLVDLYESGQSISQICKDKHIDPVVVTRILIEKNKFNSDHNIKLEVPITATNKKTGEMLSFDNQYLAADYLMSIFPYNNKTRADVAFFIMRTIRGSDGRKTYRGFIWKKVE